jgi:hypothetical protein
VDFKEGQIKIYLTRTGLLMEGHGAQNPGQRLMSEMAILRQLRLCGVTLKVAASSARGRDTKSKEHRSPRPHRCL